LHCHWLLQFAFKTPGWPERPGHALFLGDGNDRRVVAALVVPNTRAETPAVARLVVVPRRISLHEKWQYDVMRWNLELKYLEINTHVELQVDWLPRSVKKMMHKDTMAVRSLWTIILVSSLLDIKYLLQSARPSKPNELSTDLQQHMELNSDTLGWTINPSMPKSSAKIWKTMVKQSRSVALVLTSKMDVVSEPSLQL